MRPNQAISPAGAIEKNLQVRKTNYTFWQNIHVQDAGGQIWNSHNYAEMVVQCALREFHLTQIQCF